MPCCTQPLPSSLSTTALQPQPLPHNRCHHHCVNPSILIKPPPHRPPRPRQSDPFVVVYLKEPSGALRELGRTECLVNNLSPVFVRAVHMVSHPPLQSPPLGVVCVLVLEDVIFTSRALISMR
jgi:hypothetical protein